MGCRLMLGEACATGRRLTRDELEARRWEGERAAGVGVGLRLLIRAHLAAAHEAQQQEPPAVAVRMFAVAEQALGAFVEGYERAQSNAVRQEVAARREFVDDLLYGRSDPGKLAERATRFGLRLSQAHAVAVAEGREPYGDGYPVARGIEEAVLARFGNRNVLVATKDGG